MQENVAGSSLEFRLRSLFPASRLQLALAHGEESFPEKSFVLTAELHAADGIAISPKQLSWYYSSFLGTNFHYVPASGDGVTLVPHTLESEIPFSCAHIKLATWGDRRSGTDVGLVFETLLYSYRLHGDGLHDGLTGTQISGVLMPMRLAV